MCIVSHVFAWYTDGNEVIQSVALNVKSLISNTFILLSRCVAKGRPGRAQAHPMFPAHENLKKLKNLKYSNTTFKYLIKAVEGP